MSISALRLVQDTPARAVTFPYPGPLPCGGRMCLDTAVAEVFIAQVEIMCAPDGSKRLTLAIARRDRLLACMDPRQRNHVAVVASAMARLAAGPTSVGK